MAITYDGEKRTAKQLAQELLADGVSITRGYWFERAGVDWEAMTDAEKERVNDQLQKVGDRIARMLGFNESWSG